MRLHPIALNASVRLLISFLLLPLLSKAAVPPDYQGKPFADSFHKSGPPSIPGIVQCALFDLGGEGIAYHDADSTNHGSGELNLQPGHQRAHANAYLWGFRASEGVDLSYVKDWAELNHTNLVTPHINQLYIGWTATNEWCNYTVDVKSPGTYKIKALYSFKPNTVTFDLNGHPAATCKIPMATSSYHHWNFAEMGTITFSEPGLQLLTFHYTLGNNWAYFQFEKMDPTPSSK